MEDFVPVDQHTNSNTSNKEAQALTQQDTRRLKRTPDILRRQLEFPYIDGFAFVNGLAAYQKPHLEAILDQLFCQPSRFFS